jgi:hypothetical protein
MNHSPEPAEAGTTTARWTYGGPRAGRAGKRLFLWIAEDGTKLLYAKANAMVIGGYYEAEFTRADGTVTLHGQPRFTGDRADEVTRAKLEADAQADQTELATAALERRAARDPAIGRALEPLERLAAGMNAAQRRALIQMTEAAIWKASRK